ncbi:MAG: hypothetical protein O3C21_12435 [Verrucomicrobia bacterium]|nr:hypothetical protein [Verrucomicrobiota bacterium]
MPIGLVVTPTRGVIEEKGEKGVRNLFFAPDSAACGFLVLPGTSWVGGQARPHRRPDARGCPRGIRSLGCRPRFAILAAVGGYAGSRGTGSPELSAMA